MKKSIWLIAAAAATSLLAASCFVIPVQPSPAPAPSPEPSEPQAPANIPPVAYIDSIIPSPAVQGQSVSFQGHGTDKDGTVAAYRWSSSLDGDLGATATFESSSLSEGNHTISLIVQDNNGDWSEKATTTLSVAAEAPPEEVPVIEDITWQLKAYGDVESPKSVLSGTTVTVEFNSGEGQVGGSSGCNSYRAGYKIDGNELSIIPPIQSTMMLCIPSTKMTQEQQFLDQLKTAETFQVEAGKLIISCAHNKELVFVEQAEETPPEETPPIEDITWQLEAYGDGETVKSVLAGTTITAKFDSDEGKVGGSAGCNSYFAEYEIDGNKLTIIPPVNSTMMLCLPSTKMAQEHEFLDLLKTAKTYKIHEHELTILCAGDGVLMFMEAG